jgi:hypothetical protein
MSNTLDLPRLAASILAVPDEHRDDAWCDRAWSAADALRAAGQNRRAQDIEDAAERAEQQADAAAEQTERDRWPGSRWTHRGERVTIEVVSVPEVRGSPPVLSVRVRDRGRLRWESVGFLLEQFERG